MLRIYFPLYTSIKLSLSIHRERKPSSYLWVIDELLRYIKFYKKVHIRVLYLLRLFLVNGFFQSILEILSKGLGWVHCDVFKKPKALIYLFTYFSLL